MFCNRAFCNLEYNLRKRLADMSLQHSDVSICEFEAIKTLDCYTIHYQNCNTYDVGVAVYKIKAFCNLEYNIEKAPANLIILQSKGLNLADLFYCKCSTQKAFSLIYIDILCAFPFNI